ncbi:hypothetical protein MferCBS31731_002664 [Microsporum ferrugineum]
MPAAYSKARLLDGASILADPLPNILSQNDPERTDTAFRGSYYQQEIKIWNIKEETRTWTSPKYLKEKPILVGIDSSSEQPSYAYHDYYLCGDEQSVCGNFAQHALGPASAVALHNGINYRFGDYKACLESQNSDKDYFIPDHVAVAYPAESIEELHVLPENSKPRMVLVGEEMTSGNHFLGCYVQDYEDGDQISLRLALGQIAFYMHRFQMRYGFLTTYDETIFLKQVIEEGVSQLHVSQPIKATSSGSNESDVSVRQCLYYLLSVINQTGGYNIENTFTMHAWVNWRPTAECDDDSTTIPITHHIRPPNPVSQMAPVNANSFSPTDPLVLVKNGSGYQVDLFFGMEDVREDLMGNGMYVEICGEKVYVTIDNSARRRKVTFETETTHSENQKVDSKEQCKPSDFYHGDTHPYEEGYSSQNSSDIDMQ